MRRKFLPALVLFAFMVAAQIIQAANISVTQPITTNTNWTNDNTYTLYGDIIVKSGATLTIQEGTLIKADKSTLSRLVVATGGKLMAQGSAARPIVFTSSQASGQRARGDWAGIAICGLAPVNFKDAGGNSIQGRVECGQTTDYDFGGSNPTDNSGILSYVRIEYAGYVCGSNTELNSLTLCAVGSGTKIDHVQVSFGQDDGFEFFGGTVNVNNLVSFASRDDDFDTDNGWSGKAQFGLIIRVDTIADQGDVSNGFESDNNAAGDTLTPRTSGVFSNFTVVGPAATKTSTIDAKYGWGGRLRRNTSISVFNSIIMGYKRGLRIEGSLAQANATAGNLAFKNNIIAGSVETYAETAFDSAYLQDVANANTIYGTDANVDVKLANPYGNNPDDLNFLPNNNSPAASGADFSNGKLSGFTTTTHRGAFGTTDWTDCWGEFSPQNEDYTTGPIKYDFTVAVQQTGNLPATLNAVVPNGNYSFNWSNGGTTQSVTVPTSGTYKVTVTSARGCSAEGSIAVQALAPVNVVAPITTNTTWTNDKAYIIYGDIIVKNGATLTIQPGTLIKGDKSSLSRIVVATGSKIIARGTPTQPIVFTSNQPAGQRKRADWAGIAVCGLAPVNFKNAGGQSIQGRVECGNGTDYDFGGSNANDSSGVLSYVRIEYAGYVCGSNTELNSLTLCGVGAKTQIDHVMVSYGQDDGFELFGGTANLDHVISFAQRDDDFDTDNGWSGTAQYGLVVRVDTIADQGDVSNAFESDNNAAGDTLTPRTSGVISNFTVRGPAATTGSTIDAKYGWGARLRRNTAQSIFNSVFFGYKRGLRIEGALAQANATAGDLAFKNNVIAGTVETYAETGFDSTYLQNVANANTIYGGNANDSIKLASPFGNPDNFDFVPQAGSPLLAGADFTNGKLSSFESTAYRGAFGTDNWTRCWSEFSPQDEDYSAGPINYSFQSSITALGSNLTATAPQGTNTFMWSTGDNTQTVTVTTPGTYTVTVSNARGCDVTASFTYTSIAELNENISAISLFPNPTTSQTTLEVTAAEPAEVNVVVADITGKVMLNQTTQLSSGINRTTINTIDYAAGIYLVQLRNGVDTKTIRLVVNK